MPDIEHTAIFFICTADSQEFIQGNVHKQPKDQLKIGQMRCVVSEENKRGLNVTVLNTFRGVEDGDSVTVPI
jgi:hypothetical protein